ncbi:peptidase S8/S53 domain-containing protein [Pyrenochaeta sp. MPI-SDFR-AT-0127]|nr:peptidase S8/S53 domain-containing protein [Pyrenochaeta sp. MPI-SDFR-AT-0127]
MRLSRYLFSVLSATPLLSAAADSEATTPIASEDSIVSGAYIVELDNGSDATALYNDIRAGGLSINHRMNLNFKLFNGASFTLGNTSDPDVAVARIAEDARVKNVWPVRKIQFPKPEHVSLGHNGTSNTRRPFIKRETTSSDEETTHIMTQVNKLRAEGITGEGIRIGVVDTGIDYRHPALGGDNFWYGAAGPEPDSDPLDTCQGHGTHVAGIIAAQENDLGFTGVAPGVKLGAYKVSGCPGYTTSEILIAAFNMAYEDGSDIISCSSGDDSGWASDPAAIAASRIADQGVPVIVALGNSGTLGVWQAASPAAGTKVSGIGSVDNTVFPTLLLAGEASSGNGSKSSTFGWRQGVPPIADQTNLTMALFAASNDPASENDACEPLLESTPNLAERITLVRLSSLCTTDTQAANIRAKGGKNILFYPQNESQLSTVYIYEEGIEGTGLVTPRQGAEWKAILAKGQQLVITLTDPLFSGLTVENFDNGPRAGYISSFSSWGPTWEVEVKPQFVAPGGNILSTWIWDQGGYAVHPGTSMSTPFVAGVFALVGQARGTLDAKVLRNIISSTSKPNAWHDGQSAHDILAPVAQQGAGLVQAYDAAKTVTILSVSSLSCNDSDHFVASHSFHVANTGKSDITYSIGHNRAATVYTYALGSTRLYPSRSPQVADAWASLEFESVSISIPAGGSAVVNLSITPPAGLNNTLLPVYGGYVTLNGTNGENLSLPYVGVAGSLRNTPVLTAGIENFGSASTYLSSTVDRYLMPVAPNTTFTIPRPDSNTTAPMNTIFPKVVVLPSVGMPRVRVDIEAVGNSSLPVTDWFGTRSLGQLPNLVTAWASHVGFTSNFQGYTEDRAVIPAGTYRFVVSALRINGDEAKKSDWDFVALHAFTLNYL